MGHALEHAHIFGQIIGKIALVATGHTGKAAIPLVGVGEEKGDHRQAVAHDAIPIAIPVIRFPVAVPFAAMQATGATTFGHKDAVVVVNPKLWP